MYLTADITNIAVCEGLYEMATMAISSTLTLFALFLILDDLNVTAIVAAVVIVALVIASCGLGVYYAQRKGYFSSK